MRLWSIHPKYLDRSGLLALWREGLLARAVLNGNTKGYTKHPQLDRFRGCVDPSAAIDAYLAVVASEAAARGYRFDTSKIDCNARCEPIRVSEGQIGFEGEHLKRKLMIRDAERYRKLIETGHIEPHPIFEVIKGDVELWERIKQ